jgi:methylmalonyl-CoA mutase N-terminal domain/subunit
VEERRYINVGVNDFVEKDEKAGSDAENRPPGRTDQVEELRRFKQGRDNGSVSRSLEAIRAAAKDGSNLMPPLLEGVKRGVTLGEVVETLKAEFGEWREPPIYW